MNIAFALLSGGWTADLAGYSLHEISSTFWVLIVGMALARVSLLLFASVLLVEVLAVH